MKKLLFSYILRLAPAIIGLLGGILNSSILFLIGGGFCFVLHVAFFFRQTPKPVGFIVLIYLITSLITKNLNGIVLGAVLSTFFEMSCHAIKTYAAIKKFRLRLQIYTEKLAWSNPDGYPKVPVDNLGWSLPVIRCAQYDPSRMDYLPGGY